MLSRTLLAIACAGFAIGVSPANSAAGAEHVCTFKDADARWVQRALDGWDLVRRQFLKVEPRPLPWIILYDATCVWDLAPTDPPLAGDAKVLNTTLTFDGASVRVRAAPHRGTVLLPNRVEIAIDVKASTALYRNGRATFLAMSMPSVWRADRRHASKPFLDEYLQGVFVHELTHTLQLMPINRRLRRLVGRSDVPAQLTDDAIQAKFGKERRFARAFERERDLFYRAAAARDGSSRRDLVRKALDAVDERHDLYFRDGNVAYEEIEGLFLTMEGAAQWAAFSLARTRDTRRAGDAAALNLVRDDRRYWSQELGLALFMLLDVMMPDWQKRVFEPLPPSPFVLLREAVSGPTESGFARSPILQER